MELGTAGCGRRGSGTALDMWRDRGSNRRHLPIDADIVDEDGESLAFGWVMPGGL